METLIPLTIVIADRTYRIKALPSNEEAIRSIVKQLNEKIVEFKTAYAGKDIQDYLAMAVIWMATNFQDVNIASLQSKALAEELSKLTLLLQDVEVR